MGEEHFARWLGDTDWREPAALQRLFASVDTALEDTGVGAAPPETVALWVKLVATMGPDETRGLRGTNVQAVGPREPECGADCNRSQAPRARGMSVNGIHFPGYRWARPRDVHPKTSHP